MNRSTFAAFRQWWKVRMIGGSPQGRCGDGGTPPWGTRGAGPDRRGGRARRRYYFQEASPKFSCVSGLTLGGSTSGEKAIEGGELEMGSPGRASMTISLSSW